MLPHSIVDRRKALIRAALSGPLQQPAQVELIPFLRARLADDEAAARSAAQHSGTWSIDETWWLEGIEHEVVGNGEAYCHPHNVAHLARHDPDRVLREIEAKRALIEFAADATGLDMQVDSEFAGGPRAEPYIGDEMLRTMAAVYSDHPDYRQEWQPALRG